MPRRLTHRAFIGVRAALLALAALAMPVTVRGDPRIESITVKWHADAVNVDATVIPDALRASLATALGFDVTQYGRTRDGAFQLRLPSALPIDVARSAINRARSSAPRVVYANLNSPVAEATTLKTKDVTESIRQPLVRGLIVKYRDPAITAMSVQNSVLGERQLAQLSVLAGRPIAHGRAMSGGAFVVRLFQGVSFSEASTLAAAIAADPAIEYADPDGWAFHAITPNDPRYIGQWHFKGPPTYGVNLPAAWDITTGSNSVNVAVIDTGILPHPDLVGRYLSGYDMVSFPASANDADPPGCTDLNESCSRDADPTDPGDWITYEEDLGPIFTFCGERHSSWHGTHVSGIIAAHTNNNLGVAGINWVSKTIPVRVLGKCGGEYSDIIDGITWAFGGNVPGAPNNPSPARIMNLSLGGPSPCFAAMQAAVTNAVSAGSVVVAAAGNNNDNADTFTPGNCNGVITVAATDLYGERASYSNYGSLVEISAPGGSDGLGVLSTLNGGPMTADPNGYTYATYYGTSMATAHVSGIASLLLSINPRLTPAQVLATIQTTARAFPTGTGLDCNTFLCGAGIIDAGAATRAVQAALAAPALVYSPLQPCRIMDSRNATAASGVQGPITGGVVYHVPGSLAAGQNWGQYGGAGASDCSLFDPTGAAIYAVTIVATVLNPNYDAYLGLSDASDLSTVLSNVALNFTQRQGLSTTYTVPQISSNNINFAMPPQLSADLIFDVVGYFSVIDATSLQCTSNSSTPTIISAGSSDSATSPACGVGYALTMGNCDSTSVSLSLSQHKSTAGNAAWLCTAMNRGSTSANLVATARCCRVPGK